MLAIMEFIFSSFWVWLGTTLLIGSIGAAFHGAFLGIRGVQQDGCSCSRKK